MFKENRLGTSKDDRFSIKRDFKRQILMVCVRAKRKCSHNKKVGLVWQGSTVSGGNVRKLNQ